MPSFLLRNVDPLFWSKVQAKAKAEGVPVKALILRLLASWLAAVFVLALGAGCAYHNPTAPSSATPSPVVNLTPASIRLNAASRADRQLDISAEVLSADGHPVPNVALDFAIADGTVTPSTATTDATGVAHTIAAPSSVTLLTVTGPGISGSTRVDGSTTPPADLSVRLSANGATVGSAAAFGVATAMALTRADWDFGDSTTATTNSGTTTHVYGRSGVFTASVTISDAAGHTASASASVTMAAAPVAAPATPASLSVTIACATPSAGTVSCNLAAGFGGAAIASNQITFVKWDWADGQVQTVIDSPLGSHHYTQPGTYQVTATLMATAAGVAPAPQPLATQTVTIP